MPTHADTQALPAGASVRNNHALKGGGVALIGGMLSSTTPARVDLYLTEGASISNNAANEHTRMQRCTVMGIPFFVFL